MSLEKTSNKFDAKKWALISGGAVCTLGLGYFMYQQLFGKEAVGHSCSNHLKTNKNGLDEELAILRKSQIKKSVNYHLFLQVDKDLQKFKGRVQIIFNTEEMTESAVDLASQPSFDEDIFLDYAGTILSGEVNGYYKIDKDYVEKNSNGHLFRLNRKFLRSGKNEVNLDFESDFSRSGEGMSHVFDEKNNENYIFTWFETFGAHTCFPCFDQLDIKGQFDLMIRHPSTWKAVSNTKAKTMANTCKFFEKAGKEITTSSDSVKTTSFIVTKNIPIYTFSINCGDFETLTCPKRHNNTVSVAIHCRRSTLAGFKENKDWLFETILFGLKTQEQLCGGVKYQWSKCDFIFTPNVGDFYAACENPGCITFKDDMFLNLNHTFYRKMLQTIMWHELGHMWYGACVTNKWWGETWLKEAFADYLTYHTQAKFEELKLAESNVDQKEFYMNTSGHNLFLAFRLTGSLQTEMEEIKQRSVSFELKEAMYGNLGYETYIYGKSVSCQTELFELLGGGERFLNEFSKIMFEEFKFNNIDSEQWTEVANNTVSKIGISETLLGENMDLKTIVKGYFNAPGFDTISVKQNFDQLNIIQTPSRKNEFRTHCIYVSVHHKDGTFIKEEKVLVKPQAITTVSITLPETSNWEDCVVVPNSRLTAYLNLSFDEEERKFFRNNVNTLKREILNVFVMYGYTAMLSGSLDAYTYVQDLLAVINTNPNYFLSHYAIRNLSVAAGLIKKENKDNFNKLVQDTLRPHLDSFVAKGKYDIFEVLLRHSPDQQTSRTLCDLLMNNTENPDFFLGLGQNQQYTLCEKYAVTNVFSPFSCKRALERLKIVAPKKHDDLIEIQKVKKDYSVAQLTDLYALYKTKKFYSQEALKDRGMMAELVSRSGELGFDYFEDFMTMLPDYFMENEFIDNISFFSLCPSCDDKKKLRDRLFQLYELPDMDFSHKWLLRNKISSLDFQARLN